MASWLEKWYHAVWSIGRRASPLPGRQAVGHGLVATFQVKNSFGRAKQDFSGIPNESTSCLIIPKSSVGSEFILGIWFCKFLPFLEGSISMTTHAVSLDFGAARLPASLAALASEFQRTMSDSTDWDLRRDVSTCEVAKHSPPAYHCLSVVTDTSKCHKNLGKLT